MDQGKNRRQGRRRQRWQGQRRQRLMATTTAPPPVALEPPASSFWLARWQRTIFFAAIALTIAGVYAFFRTPIAVFPETNFPRVVIGIDNGVMPIDQMTVTVTRPVEEAVNSVLGLQLVQSITSRGSAEIDLYFNWNVDMFQTLERVNSAMARVRSTLPATAEIRVDRLTFASFPIMGYSGTS